MAGERFNLCIMETFTSRVREPVAAIELRLK